MFADEALGCNSALPLSKKLAIFWVRLHKKRRSNSYQDRNQSLEKEDMPPIMQPDSRSAKLWNACQSSSEQTTKCSSHGRRRDEDSNAEEQLIAFVEAAKEEGNAGHYASLCETEEGASDAETGK